MLSPEFRATPIKVCAERPRLDMLCSRLRALGLKPMLERDGEHFDADWPILVDESSSGHTLSDLKTSERLVVTLGFRNSGIAGVYLENDSALRELPTLIARHTRRKLLERETVLRDETALILAGRFSAPADQTSPRALYVGARSPNILALSSELKARSIDYVAALSLADARRHMSRSVFDIVVAAPADDASNSKALLTLVDELSAGTAFLFVGEATGAQLYPFGAAIPRNTSPCEIADLVENLIDGVRGAEPLSPDASLPNTLVDRATGMFSKAFFIAHLARQMEEADTRAMPISIAAIRLKDSGDAVTDIQMLKRAGAACVGTVRRSDTVARLDGRTFVMSLPGSGYVDAAAVAQRCVASLDSGLADQFRWRAVERRRYHDADLLAQSALEGRFSTARSAA